MKQVIILLNLRDLKKKKKRNDVQSVGDEKGVEKKVFFIKNK